MIVSSLSATLCALANHGPGTSGGGSSTASGETLRKGAFEISLSTDYTLFEDFTASQAANHALQSGEFDAIDHAFVQSLGLSYGVSDDLQLGAQIGYYFGSGFLDAESNGMGGMGGAEVASADPQGLTDLWINGKYRLAHGASGHVALLAGVKLPTGKDDEKLSNGEKLEPSSQPGTGAFDARAGLAYSRYLTSRWTFDASGIYTLRGEHDDFRVGDRVDLGVAAAYRLTEDIKSFPNYSASAELVGVWLGKDEDDGVENDNSGGETLYLSPGFRARIDEHVALTLAPAFPIAQDLNGDQVETRGKLLFAVSFSL